MATHGVAHINSGEAHTEEIVLCGANLIAIQIPGTMTNTSLNVQARFYADDDWDDLYYEGVLVSVPATVNTKQKFRPGALVGLYSVRLAGSGNEANSRAIHLQIEGLV